MDTALYYKFTQHKDLKQALLATGDAELIEVRSGVSRERILPPRASFD